MDGLWFVYPVLVICWPCNLCRVGLALAVNPVHDGHSKPAAARAFAAIIKITGDRWGEAVTGDQSRQVPGKGGAGHAKQCRRLRLCNKRGHHSGKIV